MAQRQFRSDDTESWADRYGTGKDGSLTVSGSSSHSCANQGCSGTSGTTTLTLDGAGSFADGDLILIHQTRGTGVGAWELNKILSGGGTTTLTLAYNLINTYTDSGASQAQVYELKEYTDVTVNGSVTYSASDWAGNTGGILAFLVNGPATITGTLNAGGAGFRGGAGSVSASGSSPLPFKGESETAATVQKSSDGDTAANGTGGCGGGGGDGGSGAGGGGHAAGGTNGTNNQGNPGLGGNASTDVASGVTSSFGGSGGGGRGESNQGSSPGTNGNGGNGGDSGGFILVIAKSITITGGITNNGANGSDATFSPNEGGGGGGGGSGGFVLLKGQNLSIGSSLISVAAGSGGQGSGGGNGDGGAGAVGRIHADYSASLTGTTSPTIDSSVDAVLAELPEAANYFIFM